MRFHTMPWSKYLCRIIKLRLNFDGIGHKIYWFWDDGIFEFSLSWIVIILYLLLEHIIHLCMLYQIVLVLIEPECSSFLQRIILLLLFIHLQFQRIPKSILIIFRVLSIPILFFAFCQEILKLFVLGLLLQSFQCDGYNPDPITQEQLNLKKQDVGSCPLLGPPQGPLTLFSIYIF